MMVVGGPTSNSDLYHESDETVICCTLCSCKYSLAFFTFLSSAATTLTASKSPGIIMAATTGGFPFTNDQWKELEIQAMIYKYIMACLPVPPHLLLPIHSQSHLSNGCGSNKLDGEPGRCKRTDGKKWRCSRDVVPHHKYCERHLHKSRPRSRKHVELLHHHPPNFNTTVSAKKTRLHENQKPTTPVSVSNHHVVRSKVQPNENPQLLDTIHGESNRGLNWIMEGEMGTNLYGSEQQWLQMMNTNIGLSSDVFSLGKNYREDSLNMLPNLDFGASVNDSLNNHECALFLNSDLVSLENEIQTETPRGFIDAWSNETMDLKNGSSLCSKGNLSPDSLTLSMAMAAGDVLDEEMCSIQMGSSGLAATATDSDDNNGGTHKHAQGASWLNHHHVSWMGGSGGPLAEAFGPSPVANEPSRASSPSCSGCNSPTLAGSMAAQGTIDFQFLN